MLCKTNTPILMYDMLSSKEPNQVTFTQALKQFLEDLIDGDYRPLPKKVRL